MAYIQVGLRLGGQVRGGGGAPPSTVSAWKGGHAAGLPQTCLEEKKGARGNLCALREEAGVPPPQNEGPPADSAWAPSPSGEGMGVGADFSPHYPCPLLLHPTPGEGPRGGRPGARQPPGPPAAVAVVTAPANWPAERA